jgi:uncharacterized protein DUF6235
VATRRRRRLNAGVAILERWTETARQADKNAVYDVLFAVSNGTVFNSHKVFDDVNRPGEFFVMARQNLVVKIGIYPFNNFGISYIGTVDGASDLDLNAA